MSTEFRTLRLRLQEIEAVGSRIKLFRFVAADGALLPPATPGAHLDIEIAEGVVRQYSLVEIDPAGARYTIAVLRQPEGRGGSVALHAASIGALFNASAPRNHFPLSDEPGETVLFGGGIGVTPLLAMHQALTARGAAVKLYYWTRAEEDVLLPRLRDDPSVTLFTTQPGPAPKLADLLPAIPATTRLYCCGPEPMLQAFAAATQGRPADLLHTERFAPAAPVHDDADAPFTVILQRLGRTLEIPADKTILQVCLDEAIDVPYSCEEGICGACEVKLLAGVPLHRDSVAPPDSHARAGTMIICCSRAVRGPLVLDI